MLTKDRVLWDGREVELIKTGWEPDTRGKMKQVALVALKPSGQMMKVWYYQLRPVHQPKALKTAEPALDFRYGATPAPNVPGNDVDASFALRYNGVVRLTHARGVVWGRIVQKWESPMGEETTKAYDPERGVTMDKKVDYYRVRVGNSIDLIPEYHLEPVGGPGLTWLWREGMPKKAHYELEWKIRTKGQWLLDAEAAQLGVLLKHDDSKRPVDKKESVL